MQFHSDAVEDKMKEIDRKLHDQTQNGNLPALEAKLTDLEDRESWKYTEAKLKQIIKVNLGIRANVLIERTHRSDQLYVNSVK